MGELLLRQAQKRHDVEAGARLAAGRISLAEGVCQNVLQTPDDLVARVLRRQDQNVSGAFDPSPEPSVAGAVVWETGDRGRHPQHELRLAGRAGTEPD